MNARPVAETPLEVIYRDPHFLAVVKPVGLATTAPGGGACLVHLAQRLDASAPALHPLSRLDTQVSGLVVFARTKAANHAALRARQDGRLLRRYVALSDARLASFAGEVCVPIGLNPHDPKHRVALAPGTTGPGVKASRTEYTVRAETPWLRCVDLYPRTGRTHQLRVHMAWLKAPILGDPAYGGPRRLVLPDGRVLSARRVMLHCEAVTLPGPDGRTLSLATPAPEDMVRLWQAAGGPPSVLTPARSCAGPLDSP